MSLAKSYAADGKLTTSWMVNILYSALMNLIASVNERRIVKWTRNWMLYILHNKFVRELWKVFAVLEIDKGNEIYEMKCLGNTSY